MPLRSGDESVDLALMSEIPDEPAFQQEIERVTRRLFVGTAIITFVTAAVEKLCGKKTPEPGLSRGFYSVAEKEVQPEAVWEDFLSLEDGASLIDRKLTMQTINGDRQKIRFEVRRNMKKELVLFVNGTAYKSANEIPYLNVKIDGAIDTVTFHSVPQGKMGWETVVITSELCGEMRIAVMEISRILSALSKGETTRRVQDAHFTPSDAAEKARKFASWFTTKNSFNPPYDLYFEPVEKKELAQANYH